MISKLAGVALAFVLVACSVTISDVTPGAGNVTIVPTVDNGPTQPGQAPTVGVIQTNTPGVTPSAAPASLPWADLNLTGSLIYTQGKLGLFKLNLATGQSTTMLPGNQKMWLSAQATSPDGQTIMIAYSPPPTAADQVQLGYTGLYKIASDGSTVTPDPVLPQADPQESYFNPVWTPDGKYVYYAHFVPMKDATGQGNTFKYTIERIAYPDGQPEVIMPDAIWPKISPDGTKLLYLKFDTVQYTQVLYTADLDGQNPTPVLPNSDFPSVDAQFYSNDGKTIVFNAVGEGQAPALSFFDRLMGVNIADAHNVPSDWWSITQGQDKPVRLTKLYDTGMYGDFSPDGNYIAFLAASGMYVMSPDGSLIKPLIQIKSLGTLEWVP